MDTEDQYKKFRKFLYLLGFNESSPFVFTNGNIMVYFRANYNQWRIMDTNAEYEMDLTSINFPLDNLERSRIERTVSENYKE